MRTRASNGIVVLLLLTTCEQPPPELADIGEPCVESIDCRDELVCDQSACVDDTGPAIFLFEPMTMDAFDPGAEIWVSASVGIDPLPEGDSVELTFDPHGPAPVTMTLPPSQFGAGFDANVPAPTEPGAHWVRVRVLDADGEPRPNPSATQYVNVFVRDPVHPDRPMIAILEPRPDHRHVLANGVEVHVGVLPGSFTFSNFAGQECQPLPGCADPFAPECEDECGPISRVGHAKLHLRDDFPQCVLDEPISCFLDYIASIRPGEGNQIDAYILVETLEAEYLEVGTFTLSASLSYDYHEPYPTPEALIYTSQELTIVESID